MDSITSSEFRKTYTTLREVTEVTVLGRAIGVWTPFDQVTLRASMDELVAAFHRGVNDPNALAEAKRINDEADRRRAFNSKPFTPAPKRGK